MSSAFQQRRHARAQKQAQCVLGFLCDVDIDRKIPGRRVPRGTSRW